MRITTLGKGTQCCEFIPAVSACKPGCPLKGRSTVLFSKAIIGLKSYKSYTVFCDDIIALYYR